MSDLQSRLHRLRSRIRYAVWLHGVSWMVVALLGAVLFIGFVDWRLHVDDSSARLFLGLTVLIAAGVLAWRTLIQPLRARFSDVAIALKIERRYPGFHDSLASSVEFSEQHEDPRLGSPVLQRQVIDETMRRLESVNVDDVVETRGVRRAGWIAVGVCLFVAAVAGWKPAEASLALQRLMFPFSAQEWPRETQLVLLDRSLGPLAVASGEPFRRVQGDTFKFYVADKRGRLPDDVTLLLRYGDGETQAEKLRRVSIRDSSGTLRELCVANLLVERGPITFRVGGGDDHTMRDRTLKVVPAPRLKTLRVELQPPKYTGRPVNRLPDGVGHFEALVGTRVVVNAQANKPLQAAHLRVKNRTLPGLKLSKDGRQLTAEFTVTESGNYSYWFEFKDREGFENPQAPRYDVKALADRVPVVRLVAPSEDVRITAGDKARGLGTVVTVKPLVEDDLGIRTVALRYRFEYDEKGKFRTKVLFPGDQMPESPNKRDKTENRREYNQPCKWKLKDVTEGMQVRFFIEAADDFDLDPSGRPVPTPLPRHVGRSLTRTITIVTPAEKNAEIAGKYGQLLEDLVRAEKLQRRAHEQVGQLRVQLQKTKRLRPNEDLSLLNRVIQDQTDVSQQLVDADTSVRRRARRALDELRANHLANPALQRRLGRIAAEMEALRLRRLRKIIDELRAVDSSSHPVAPASKKAGRPPTADPVEQLARLKNAESQQREVLTSLAELIGELSEWRNWQDLAGEAKDLIARQQEIQRDAELVKRGTLGTPANELTPQQRADLARLAERQRRIGDRIQRLRRQIGKFLGRLRKEPDANKPAIETLTDVDRFLRDQNLAERTQTTAGKIERNELGEMSQTQKQLVDDLREMLAILENRGTDDLETLIKRQKETEAELQTLQKRQGDVLERLRKLGSAPKTAEQRGELQRLIKEQQQLRKKAAETARRLRRLSANRANDSTQQAADSMDRALQSLRREGLQQARLEQKETLDRLEQARRELARTRQKLEAALAAEALQRMADDLLGLIRRQNNVIAETTRLKTEFERTRKWTRGRRITLDTTRDEQDRLRARIAELAKSSAASPIFFLALNRVAAEMQSSVKALAGSKADAKQLDTALTHESEAKRQLVQLVNSLRPDKRGSTAPPPGDGGGRNGAQQVAGPSHVAQLKLLKSLQDELKDRTAEFDGKRKPAEPLTPQQKRKVDELASRQEKLADLARDFMRDVGIRSGTEPEVSPPKKPVDKQAKSKSGKDAPQAASEDPADVLRRSHRNMRAAGKSLGRRETGAATRKTQQQVSDDLDRLIRSAARQPVEGGGTPNTSPAVRPAPRNGGPKQNGTQSPMGKANTQGNSATGSQRKSPKSDPRIRRQAEGARKAAIARQERMIQEVWGQLPELVQRQLRNNMSADSYLPTYKPLITRYFESLAE
jgi:hypothetical protein